jgi:hypothetical protein
VTCPSTTEIDINILDDSIRSAIIDEARNQATELQRSISRRRVSEASPPKRTLSFRRSSLEPKNNPNKVTGMHGLLTLPRRQLSFTRGRSNSQRDCNVRLSEEDTSQEQQLLSPCSASDVPVKGESDTIPQSVISISDDHDECDETNFGSGAGGNDGRSDDDHQPAPSGPTNPILGTWS